jgi:hypothetical protein
VELRSVKHGQECGRAGKRFFCFRSLHFLAVYRRAFEGSFVMPVVATEAFM